MSLDINDDSIPISELDYTNYQGEWGVIESDRYAWAFKCLSAPRRSTREYAISAFRQTKKEGNDDTDARILLGCIFGFRSPNRVHRLNCLRVMTMLYEFRPALFAIRLRHRRKLESVQCYDAWYWRLLRTTALQALVFAYWCMQLESDHEIKLMLKEFITVRTGLSLESFERLVGACEKGYNHPDAYEITKIGEALLGDKRAPTVRRLVRIAVAVLRHGSFEGKRS